MKNTLFKHFLFSFLGMLLSLSIFSQEDNSLKVYFPEMRVSVPESSKLSRYLSYPVSKALGLVDISIPLFEIPTPAAPIPFSISYHASGIRVEDPIGVLGYGWSLFPATRIVREINGKPDESCKQRMPSTFTLESLGDSIPYYATPTEFDYPFWGYDAEHDIFSVNINGESASFVIERTSSTQFKALKIKDSYLKIEVVPVNVGAVNGFRIQDDQGVIYNFGNTDGLMDYILSTDCEVASSAGSYLLNSICYPNGQSVSFTYQQMGIWKQFTASYAILIEKICGYISMPIPFFDESRIDPPSGTVDCVLSTINFPTGRAVFNYDSFKLSSIQLFNNTSSIVKTVDFETDQYLLKSVNLSDNGKYTLDYNSLTFKNACAQDKFGYYNGDQSATAFSMLPEVLIQQEHTGFTGSDRLVNEQYSQANMLTKITYPTGGTASFEYEANQGVKSLSTIVKCGLRIKNVKQYDPVSQKTITKTYKYGKGESGYGIALSDFNDQYHLTRKTVKWYVFPNSIPDESSRRVISPYNSEIASFGNQFKVWYDEVAEYTDEGKTVENYTYKQDQGAIVRSDLWHYIYDSPLLVKQTIYKGSELAQETEWMYRYFRNTEITGYHISANTLFYMKTTYEDKIQCIMNGRPNENCFKHGITYTVGSNSYYDYNVLPYSIRRGIYRLFRKHLRQFEGQSIPLESIENYYYNPKIPYNMIQKVVTDSKKQDLIEKTYFANDGYSEYPYHTLNLLKENNYLTSPIAKEFYRGSTANTPFRSEKIMYDQVGTNLLKPTSLYVRQQGMGGFEKQVDYSYYPNGNLATIKDKNNLQTVFLWGYNHTYLIAEIKDTTIEEVSAIVGDIGQLSGSIPSNSLLDSLRSRLPHAMVITYTHIPLVGISSITDSRGDKIVYSYNTRNQLVEIYRLANGAKQSIQTYEYKYATENP